MTEDELGAMLGPIEGMTAPIFGTPSEFEATLGELMRHRRAQLGMSTTFQAASSSHLVFFDLPSHLARPWSINLTAMRYQQGPIATSPLDPNPGAPVPPDQMAQATVFAHLEWGVDGATEVVDVDYPWTGLTFEVFAASIKLSLVTQGSIGVGPKLGAFASPGNRQGNLGRMPPTNTLAVTVEQSGGDPSAQVFIPSRARYYSVAVANSFAAVGVAPIILWQSDFDGGATYRVDSVDFNGPLGSYDNFAGERYRFPIHPLATSIVLGNASETADTTVTLRFELDLG